MKQNWTNKKHRKSLRHRPIIYPHLFAGLFFIALLIGVSFMSELQNTTRTVHAVDNEGSVESQDEVVAAVNNFYNYQRLYGCMQKYNDAPDNYSNKIDMSAVLYKDGNMGGGSSYVVGIVPDITHEDKVHCTIPYMQGIIDELSPESNIDLEQLVKDKVGESGAGDCKNINSTSPDCWNKVTGDDMVSVLSPIVNNLARSYSDRSLTDAEKFWVYNTAFDTCTEDSGDTSAKFGWGNIRGGGPIYTNSIDATNTDDYWVFDNGSTLNPGEDGKLKTEKVYAKKLHSEITSDVSGETIEHTVWPGAEEPQFGAKYSGGHNMTCKEIAAMVEQFFPAYVNALNNSGEPIADYQGGTTTDTEDEEEDACEAQLLGFGWLLCPGSNLVEKFLNNFLNAIGDNLEWTLLTTKGDEIRTRWQDFLNIANIAFAIVFLVMIYSMATSTGLSNYDVKKMLPNLIVVAIAVNLSFYLCAALVDISNIAGSGLFNILSGGKGRWDGSIGIEGLLADAGATIFFVIGAIFFFGISALIALAIIFICLCVREIALIALIVISPLAIVCYLLPNTKKWFKEWTDLFTQLLLVYPMYMAVWGAAAWVSDLAGGGDVLGGSSSIPAFAIQCVCLIAPAVAVVPLFKMSGGIMGMAASRVAGSKLAAKGNAAQSYMRGKGAGVAKNNFATRAATSRLSNRLGRFGANNANVPNGKWIHGMVGGGIRRWAGRKALMASNASSEHSHAIANELRSLDNAAMETAKNNTSSMSHDDLIAIATTGILNDRAVDQYTLRAATDAVAESMNEDQVKDMMLKRAAAARQLVENHRDAEARALLNNAADAAGKSGSYLTIAMPSRKRRLACRHRHCPTCQLAP